METFTVKSLRKFLSLILSVSVILSVCSITTYADVVWPENVSIQAEGGIVMDADTGTVLYGKNIHTTYFPASITKILTALIVIEQCDLNEMVTFSHNAVYNVEVGSSSAGLDEGDVLSVRDCLYALLLKSANESANALAEHVAGSTEAFADMMNQRAASLGCQDSHFANPSGLNDPNHYVSAYDMALIGQAALHNETFMEIDSSLYYDLPVTKRNPEGARIYPGHKMIKKNLAEYYEGCLGGKTGYTSLAGNTLVTFAKKNGMTLVSVVLNGHQTQYPDTKALLDFGFRNFQTVSAAEYDTSYTSIENDLTIAGLATTELYGLEIDPDCKITLPKSADFSSVDSQLSYEMTSSDPSDAIARINYRWGEREIGYSYLKLKTLDLQSADNIHGFSDEINLNLKPAKEEVPEESVSLQGSSMESIPGESISGRSISAENEPLTDSPESSEPLPKVQSAPFRIPAAVWIGICGAVVAVLLTVLTILVRSYLKKKEEEDRMLRRQRRLARLEDVGITPDEFDSLLERRRSSYTAKRPPKRRKRPLRRRKIRV
ncbi:MAG: D-alanyl-D-alanine carboxypeptidase [Hungatella sp.]|nr:D-alanyl-D-alanine carboxypeptidase [Hungatella sp.]